MQRNHCKMENQMEDTGLIPKNDQGEIYLSSSSTTYWMLGKKDETKRAGTEYRQGWRGR